MSVPFVKNDKCPDDTFDKCGRTEVSNAQKTIVSKGKMLIFPVCQLELTDWEIPTDELGKSMGNDKEGIVKDSVVIDKTTNNIALP